MKRLVGCALVVALCFGALGCTNMSRTQQGAASGAVLGAAAGAGIAALSGGYLGVGAAVGGVAGALAGGIVGHSQDSRHGH